MIFQQSSEVAYCRQTQIQIFQDSNLRLTKIINLTKMVRHPLIARWVTLPPTTTILTRDSHHRITSLETTRSQKMTRVVSTLAHRAMTHMVKRTQPSKMNLVLCPRRLRKSQRRRSQSFQLSNSCSQQAVKRAWLVPTVVKLSDQFEDLVLSTKRRDLMVAGNSVSPLLMSPRFVHNSAT